MKGKEDLNRPTPNEQTHILEADNDLKIDTDKHKHLKYAKP